MKKNISKNAFCWKNVFFFLASALFCAGSALANPAITELIEIEPSSDATEHTPLNLAPWYLGTSVNEVTPTGNTIPSEGESPFVSADETTKIAQNSGTHLYLIEFDQFHLIEQFQLTCYEGKGLLSLSYCDVSAPPQSTRWKVAAEPTPFSPGEITLHLNPLEARFLLIKFENTEPSTFGALGLFGAPRVEQANTSVKGGIGRSALSTLLPSQLASVDFASMSMGGKITHISSGDPKKIPYLIDDNVQTNFLFDKDASENVLIIGLDELRNISLISMTFEAPKGTFEFFPLRELPSFSRSDTGKVRLEENFFQKVKPSVTKSTDGKKGALQAQMTPTAMRYLLIRWVGDPKSGKTPFSIKEINVIAKVPKEDVYIGRFLSVLGSDVPKIPGDEDPEDPPPIPVVSP